jgi:hypothetical protein
MPKPTVYFETTVVGHIAARQQSDIIVADIEVLAITAESKSLAAEIMLRHGIPRSEPRDALHISLAAVHGIEFLLTWNFRHIANAGTRATIEQICRDCGYKPPSICSPDELLGDWENDE